MSSRQTKTRTHHFFLFRHCVRSTSDEIHFLGGQRSKNLKDYVGPNVELPYWGVPEKWCTNDGITMVENMGRWLATQGALKSATGRVRIEVLADPATQRTVDTAWALSTGLADGFQSRNSNAIKNSQVVTVEGLGQLFYDPWLFQPLEKDSFTFPGNEGGICQKNYTENELQAIIQHRLDSIPPPSPIPDALEFLMEIAGVGKAGNLNQVFPDAKPKMADNWKHLEAAPALISYFAKVAFYSRAGNIQNAFLPNMTNTQLYQQLLPWLYWARDVGQINNPREATNGAVVSRTMIQSLTEGYIHKPSSDNTADYDTTVTIVVGHDGDLDSLVTALGVSWKAPPPYLSHVTNSDYLVTPPVSAIHAQHTVAASKKSRIDLSFLCPVYSSVAASGDNSKWVNNDTGILEQSPLEWSNSDAAARWQTSPDSRVTFLDTINALEQFQQQILETLDPYSGATNCWEASGSFLTTLSQSNLISEEDASAIDLVVVLSLGGILLALFAMMWSWLRQMSSPNMNIMEQRGKHAYEGVASSAKDEKIDTELELT